MSSSLHQRIRLARKHVGLSATAAASMSGLTRKSWERYELDKNEPKASSLSMLVELGIDGTWLLTGKGEMLRESRTTKDEATLLDRDVLHMVIDELEQFRSKHHPSWDSGQLAEIVVLGYAMLLSEKTRGSEPNPKNLCFLMKAAQL
ncbi:helix-turn-helix transcriptional regulator [Thalassospira australica]|uniref:helix-turn-helix domain-containing protein n=1 Tax=Thalassospira australica TaxID=1528106 RepID=UPI00384E399A